MGQHRPLNDKTNRVNTSAISTKEEEIEIKSTKEENTKEKTLESRIENEEAEETDEETGLREDFGKEKRKRSIDKSAEKRNVSRNKRHRGIEELAIDKKTSNKSDENFDAFLKGSSGNESDGDVEYAYTYDDYLSEHIEEIHKETELSLESITSTHFKI
ncbi:hypothetical protein NEMIN01_0405 [Nematocida minor]|uniref:uncharacterized protein n=1 Tax=Nematocida minor TaxID=1912983 RepID=UPI00221EFDF3|nr:uncharacterized protein NEMIN01_0405 [Nematocida minor]KAI5189239.1 hypothetical protein NEMIN01_0405 [Nematocida minor]